MPAPEVGAAPPSAIPPPPAAVFAALGDPTRLALVSRLGNGRPLSIAELTRGAGLTRQGVTKHLRVLEGAGLVEGARAGRETRFALRPAPLGEARAWLGAVAAQWDEAIARLERHLSADRAGPSG